MVANVEIRDFDRLHAGEEEYEALNKLSNAVKKEAMPDDPPTPIEQTKLELQNIPPIVDMHMWTARLDGVMVGRADVGVPRMQTNNHLVQWDIRILSEFRGRGIGTELLRRIATVTQQEERPLMMSMTRSTIPAAERAMEALGATVGLATHVNDLKIADLDRALIESWIRKGEAGSEDFDLGVWEGAYPEAELEAIATMRQAINTMPTDTLDVEDFRWTPDELRQIDASTAATGTIRWTYYVREVKTNQLVGYTEMTWNPSQPERADQGDTAVLESYKNRGLGRWVKAAMLRKLLAERPQVKLVRTGNAQSNAPMLKINSELGFRPSVTENIWQVATDDVLKFLEGSAQLFCK